MIQFVSSEGRAPQNAVVHPMFSLIRRCFLGGIPIFVYHFFSYITISNNIPTYPHITLVLQIPCEKVFGPHKTTLNTVLEGVWSTRASNTYTYYIPSYNIIYHILMCIIVY